MEDKDIGYILVILAELFFLALLALCKHRTQTVEIEKVVERIITVTPTPTPEETPTPTASTPGIWHDDDEELGSYVQNPKIRKSSAILQTVRVTCYLATGSCCADGTMPQEGICAGAPWQIGKDCILYDVNTGEPFARLECRDTGGHYLLQTGQAIDVFRDDFSRALDWVGAHGDYALIEWIEREAE